MHDVFDGLARHRLGGEADEVAGMSRAHGHADFTVGLEATDARAMPGARIDHHEGAFLRIDRHVAGRLDTNQQVICRPFESTGVEDQFGVKVQYMGHRLSLLHLLLLAALTHQIPIQDGALHGIEHVLAGRPPGFHGGIDAVDHVFRGAAGG